MRGGPHYTKAATDPADWHLASSIPPWPAAWGVSSPPGTARIDIGTAVALHRQLLPVYAWRDTARRGGNAVYCTWAWQLALQLHRPADSRPYTPSPLTLTAHHQALLGAWLLGGDEAVRQVASAL